MVAATAERTTPAIEPRIYSDPLEAGAKVLGGTIVCLNAAGNLVPEITGLNLKAIGRAHRTTDNTGGAAGAVAGESEVGTFRYANSAAGDLITRADVAAGLDCFIVDNQTVAKTNGGGTRSIAGRVVQVDAQGVWVRFTR